MSLIAKERARENNLGRGRDRPGGAGRGMEGGERDCCLRIVLTGHLGKTDL